MEDKVCFRFLSGDNIGSSFMLSSGTYTIGTSDDCDIYVRERVTSEVIITLEITLNRKVFITLNEGFALLNSKELSKTKTELKSKDIVAINFTSFAYFKEGETIEDLSLSNLMKEETVLEQNKQEESVENLESKKESEIETTVDSTLDIKKSKKKTLVFTVIGLAILAFLFSSLIAGSYLYGKRAEERSNLAKAQEYLKDKNYANVKVKFINDTLCFDGFVLSTLQKNEFIKNLPDFSYLTIINVASLDERLKVLEDAFRLRGCNFVAKNNNDKVDIYGYIKDPYILADIVDSISKDLDISNLNYKITFEPGLLEYIKEAQVTYCLPLQFSTDKTRLLYDGSLSLEDLERFSKLKEYVNNKVGANVLFTRYDLVDDSKIVSLNSKSTDIALSLANTDKEEKAKEKKEVFQDTQVFKFDDIVGVTLEPMAFLTMANGDKYFEGAIIPNGYTIKEIRVDKLVLEKDGEESVYDFK